MVAQSVKKYYNFHFLVKMYLKKSQLALLLQ